MNQLVFIENDKVVTDTLTISEVFEKSHDKVVRDVKVQISKLHEAGEQKWSVSNFGETQYQHKQNKQWYKKFNLTEDAFALIAMSYITPKAMKMKVKFLNEFKKMKIQLQELNKPSYMIDDPIKRAEIWITEQKEKKELETKNLMLEQRVSEYEPKITYLDEILKSTDSVTVSQIAEDYGMTGQEMNKLLNEIGIQYKMGGQWLLYSKHKGNGYTKSNTVDITHTDGRRSVKMHTKWTQKGRLFIYESLKEQGVLPLMEIRLNSKNKLDGVKS